MLWFNIHLLDIICWETDDGWFIVISYSVYEVERRMMASWGTMWHCSKMWWEVLKTELTSWGVWSSRLLSSGIGWQQQLFLGPSPMFPVFACWRHSSWSRHLLLSVDAVHAYFVWWCRPSCDLTMYILRSGCWRWLPVMASNRAQRRQLPSPHTGNILTVVCMPVCLCMCILCMLIENAKIIGNCVRV